MAYHHYPSSLSFSFSIILILVFAGLFFPTTLGTRSRADARTASERASRKPNPAACSPCGGVNRQLKADCVPTLVPSCSRVLVLVGEPPGVCLAPYAPQNKFYLHRIADVHRRARGISDVSPTGLATPDTTHPYYCQQAIQIAWRVATTLKRSPQAYPSY